MTTNRELQDGVVVVDENGRRLGQSAVAAREGITAVVFSRILMSCPGMSNNFMFIFKANAPTFYVQTTGNS